ncbi:MAG: sigma-70 family RNA polymerase sigma factor [Planctomycetota bacterium]
MMLAKIARKPASKLSFGQLVTLHEVDTWLDVDSASFRSNERKVARRMMKAEATLDVASYRREREAAAELAGAPDLPDIRDALYSADLKRIQPMDREEEFRMARRHEFVHGLLTMALEKHGIAADDSLELLKQPANRVLEALAAAAEKAGDKATAKAPSMAWTQRLIDQFEQLRNIYVEGALYIVLSTVNRYRNLGVDTQDLVQEGNASLFQAIDGFDWRRDVRFRTYAQYWVHQAVLKMLYNSSRTVRVPIWVQKILGKIRKTQDAARRAGVELTHAQISERIGVPESKIAWVLSTRRYAVSLDAEIGGGGDGGDGASLGQLLPDEEQLPVPESIPAGDLQEVLGDVMADLPEREQGILRRRFGLGGKEPETLGEIADDLGITAERVRQLQNAALTRIKRPSKMRRLQPFVE